MLTKIDYTLDCKEKLSKFQNVNVILATLFDLTLHLGFNNTEKSPTISKHTHVNTHTSNFQVKGKTKKFKIKSLCKDSNNKTTPCQNV